MQGLLTSLVLPPLGLVLLSLLAGLAVLRRRPLAGLVVVASAAALLLLATPYAAGRLTVALEELVPEAAAPGAPEPAAIIILGGEMARGAAGPEIGPLTLERLRAGAALARRTGLPLLVTGGRLSPEARPIAELMAISLKNDFGIGVRWIEPQAHDTRENALLSALMLREAGIGAAYVVSHGWHLARALGAFERVGYPVVPVAVRREPLPRGIPADWMPRADHLAQSFWALREWAGLLVYRLRDGA